MKLPLLNDLLNTEGILTVTFPFDFVVLPISDTGTIVSEGQATQKHFATIVFVKEINEFCKFEFNQMLLDGLLAYNSRYKSMSKFNVLLGRRQDGTINMTIGANNITDSDSLQKKAELVQSEYKNLYSDYQNQIGYTVKDRR